MKTKGRRDDKQEGVGTHERAQTEPTDQERWGKMIGREMAQMKITRKEILGGT